MKTVTIKRFVRMKLYQQMQSENVSNMFLYGSILFASIDYVGILDYLIKAILGGGVWFGFKLLQDHYSIRARRREKEKTEKENEIKQDDKN